MFLAIILMIIAVKKTQNGLNCAKNSKVRAEFTGNTMSEN